MISAIIFGVLICIFAGANRSTDQWAYSVLYHDNNYFPVEKGYLFLTNIFYEMGLNYSQFKMIIMLAGGVLYILLTKQMDQVDCRKVLLLWVFTGFWFDIEQSRYTIAMMIVLYSIKYLQSKSISNVIKYIALILTAYTIHTATIAYLILLLVHFRENILKKLVFISSIITVMLGVVFSNISWIGTVIYRFIPNERILMWFAYKTNWGWLGPVITQVALFLMLFYGKKIIDYEYNNGNIEDTYASFYNIAYKICVVSFVFMPFYVFSTEFIRLIRGMLLVYYFCIFMSFYYATNYQKVLIWLFSIGFIILYNLQGLRGILFFNDYFTEYLIILNDFNSDVSFLYVIIPTVIITRVAGHVNPRFQEISEFQEL